MSQGTGDFLELLENVKVEEASERHLYGGEGTRAAGIRGMKAQDPRYQRALTEAANLVADVFSGRKRMYKLEEAMSTSDFPILFGDILDRQMLGRYQAWNSTWTAIARRGTVRDFRTKKLFTLDGAESALSKVKQGTEYPEASLVESSYSYIVEKYGRRLPFLWEVFINDDLDELRDAPDRLAKAARVTEDRFVTGLYASSTGPNATFFTSGNANLLTAGAGSALSTTSLGNALNAIWTQKDADGNPIFTERVTLVVPPQLAVTARNILNATEIRGAAGGGTSPADQLTARNWMANEVTDLVVNPWLPIITTTGTIGATAWYLFSSPSIGRPALEIGFLRGHETPELFVKSSNAIRVGGGGIVGAEDGDFETDAVNYKVRFVLGGSRLEPKAAVASFGQ